MELLEIAIARNKALSHFHQLHVKSNSSVQPDNRPAGLPQGPFTGVPFMLKDLGTALKGTVTTNGSRFYKDARMDCSSTVVDHTSERAW